MDVLNCACAWVACEATVRITINPHQRTTTAYHGEDKVAVATIEYEEGEVTPEDRRTALADPEVLETLIDALAAYSFAQHRDEIVAAAGKGWCA